MSPELESRIYETVLRSVIWGTERSEVFHTLQVNGVVGERAEQMFQRAWKERLASIRGEGFQKAAKGAVLLAGAGALFCVFWFGLGAVTKAIFVVCALMGIGGAWLLLGGVLDVVLAPAKKGPITPQV